MKRYKTCHAIYWQKARIKRKDIDGSERLIGICVCQWVKFKCIPKSLCTVPEHLWGFIIVCKFLKIRESKNKYKTLIRIKSKTAAWSLIVARYRHSQNVPSVEQYPVENLCDQEDKIDHFKVFMAQLFNKTILTTGCSKYFII